MMNKDARFHIPDREEFLRGLGSFEENEKLGYVYTEAIDRISHNWGLFYEMAAGIKELLHSWHQYFYSLGDFDFRQLLACIERNFKMIDGFKKRSITSITTADEGNIRHLFVEFNDALKGGKRKSPVATAKALHLLAPHFFPLWDNDIAFAYGYAWTTPKESKKEDDYVSFCQDMKSMAHLVNSYVPEDDDRPILKRIDEYNYAKYTKGWI